MKRIHTTIFAPAILLFAGTSFATTWTVDDDGKADFNNIQAAVDAAVDGDEILVMPGTYTGTGAEVVDMEGNQVAGQRKRSSEILLHLTIMKDRPNSCRLPNSHLPFTVPFRRLYLT